MENKEFNERLIEAMPEAKDTYLKEKKDFWEYEEPGSTIVVEDYLMPVVYDALDKGDGKLLSRFGNWVEEMVSSEDEIATNVIFVCIFEKAFYEERIEGLKPYFGPKTMEWYAETSFGRGEK